MSTISRYIVATLENGVWNEDKDETTRHDEAADEAARVHGRVIERTYVFDDSELLEDYSRVTCADCAGDGQLEGPDGADECQTCDGNGYVTGEAAEGYGWDLVEYEPRTGNYPTAPVSDRP